MLYRDTTVQLPNGLVTVTGCDAILAHKTCLLSNFLKLFARTQCRMCG